MGRTSVRVDRLGRADAGYLGAGRLPRPWHVAAVLRLDGATFASGLDLDLLRAELDSRSRRVARLRQRLAWPPFGLGRPYWVDDDEFRIERHVEVVGAPPDCDTAGLFALAEEALTCRFDYRHPPWKLVFVEGLHGGDIGLVVVIDHVLADGLAGIALTTALLDGGRTGTHPLEPRTPPSRVDLASDRFRGYRKAVVTAIRLCSHPVRTVRSWREMWAALFAGESPSATSLNRPTGASRRLVAVGTDLEQFHALAHVAGGTINDAVLAAVAAGLHRLLAGRGESPEVLYASIPVALRFDRSPDQLGNQVGGMRVPLPIAWGTSEGRIRRIADFTRSHKSYRLDSAAMRFSIALRDFLGSSFGNWFSNRQRLVNVFVTNVVGPAEPLSLLGAELLEIVPVAPISGNVPIAVGVLSYAGTLTLSINADPAVVPDLDTFVAGLCEAMAGALTELPAGVVAG